MNQFLQGFKVPAKLYWDENYQEIINIISRLKDMHIDYWLNHSFGRWHWWFLLFWAIFPLFIWWKYTDRSRFLEICFFGTMVSLSSGILDSIGVFLLLWVYPYDLIPFLPNFFPIDYVFLPVLFMLIYQKYSAWKAFLTAILIVSTVLSLVFDPIMVWMNLYQPLSWQYYYSIPVFVFLAGFCKGVTQIIVKRNINPGENPGE